MRLIKYIVVFFYIFLMPAHFNRLFSQTYGDKDYFLIDSLNLVELSESDRNLLNTALNSYHNAKHDTLKLDALEVITENLMHDVWVKYNVLVKKFVEQKLGENPTLFLKKRYLKSLASSINNMGVNCEQQGNLVDAILYFHKSLKIQESLNDLEGSATTLNNIGAIYNTLGNVEKTLDYFQKSLKIREQVGDKKGIAQSLNNIGSIYYSQKELSKALNNFEKSAELYKEVNDKEGLAYTFSNIGNIYDLLNSFKGLSYHKRSLKLREEIGDKKGRAFGLVNVAESQLINKNSKEALENAALALAISKEMGYPDNIQKSAYILSKIYKSLSDYPKALDYFELSVVMKDSIKNEESSRASYKLQTKYEFEKQQAVKDAEHNKQMEVIAEREAKQKIITYSIAAGLILLSVFFIFIYNRLQITKKQKSIIEEQKKLVDEKQKEILDSISYAKRIQAAILPSDRIIKQFLPESFVFYKPKDIVAGDFYWLESVKSDESRVMSNENPSLITHHSQPILFAAADCTGHGVPGAMVSVVCNNALNRSVREFELTNPGEILNKTREIVIQEFEKSEEEVKDGMDIALCSLQFDTDSYMGDLKLKNSETIALLQYAGANNPLWIIRPPVIASATACPDFSGKQSLQKEQIASLPLGVRNDGNFDLIETAANKQPIGKYSNLTPFTTHTIELQKGDTIYIFTDGYADQFGGEKGKKFKKSKLKELLLNIQNHSMNKQLEIIGQTFENWKGNSYQIDDVCIIGVRI